MIFLRKTFLLPLFFYTSLLSAEKSITIEGDKQRFSHHREIILKVKEYTKKEKTYLKEIETLNKILAGKEKESGYLDIWVAPQHLGDFELVITSLSLAVGGEKLISFGKESEFIHEKIPIYTGYIPIGKWKFTLIASVGRRIKSERMTYVDSRWNLKKKFDVTIKTKGQKKLITLFISGDMFKPKITLLPKEKE